MFRSTARPFCVGLATALVTLLAQDPVGPLPKPQPNRPAIADEAKKELAQRLCTAIDAGDPEAFDRALADGADPNLGMGAGQDDTADRTPLIHAVLADRREFGDRLLLRGARLDAGDAKDHTPLMYAALVDNAAMAEHLLRLGARIDLVDEQQSTAASYATKSKTLAERLAAAEERHRAVLTALSSNDFDAALAQLEAGASPNVHDGKTSLLVVAVQRDDPALVERLLAAGCRADLVVTSGFSLVTPLGLAAQSASMPVLKSLLASGKANRTALDDALAGAAGSKSPDRKERVRLLLAAGGNPSATSIVSTPPLPAAAALGDLETMAMLLEAGADQDAANHALIRAAGVEDAVIAEATVRALLAIGSDPNADWLFTNALGEAAERGHAAVLQLLAEDASGETYSAAVAQAARSGSVAGLRWLCEHGKGRIEFDYAPGVFDPPLVAAIGQDCLECVDVLLAAGAPAEHAPTMSCDTPLVEAVRGQRYAVIEKLLAAGADPRRKWQAPLREPLSALDVAEQIEDERALALLRAAVEKRDADRDPVGLTLARCDLNYEELPRMYRLVYTSSDNGRSQTVYVRKVPEDYAGLRVQEVFGLCYDRPEKPDAATIRRVFAKTYGIGGLVLEAPSEGQPNWRIRFRLEAPVDSTPERLRAYLDIVQATADSIERDIDPAAEDRL